MKKWHHDLQQWFSRYDQGNPDLSLRLGHGATEQEIRGLKEATGFEWNAEFCQMYAEVNGAAFFNSRLEKLHWKFLPIEQICPFIKSAREWFSETHPDVAAAFYPFFDWQSGDSVGYLNLGQLISGPVEGIDSNTLFEFDHESYEFDAEQEWTDFLKPDYESIAHFLE